MPESARPPRLFIIPSSAVDQAIVFRRGPTSWYHLLKWDMTNDSFDSGAWFRGRIYPEKCDLSADGKLLLSFVHQGRKVGTTYSDSWTAISRSPWLVALGLWPQGTTYGGGGRFIGDRHVILRTYEQAPHREHPARGLKVEFGNAPAHGSTKEVAGAEWSGRDRQGRIIFTWEGMIFRRAGEGEQDVLVKDLNGLEPDPHPAPPWAYRELSGSRKR